MHENHKINRKLFSQKYSQLDLHEFQPSTIRKSSRSFNKNIHNHQTPQILSLMRKPIKLTPLKFDGQKFPKIKSASGSTGLNQMSRLGENMNFPESLWTLKLRKDSKTPVRKNLSELSTRSSQEFRRSLGTLSDAQQRSETETNSEISEVTDPSTLDRKTFKASSVFSDLMERYERVMRRGSNGPVRKGNDSLLLVPSRRIQTLNALPEDTMAKITGKVSIPTLGFVVAEKSDSQIVEPDPELLRQCNYIHMCEKAQGKHILIKNSADISNSSFKNPEETESLRLSSTVTDSEQQSQTEAPSIVSHTSLSNPSLSDSEEEQIMDNDVKFHFNPVVQIKTNQKPWKPDLVRQQVTTSIPKSTQSENQVHEEPEQIQSVESLSKSKDADEGEGTNFDLLYENLQYVDSKIYEKQSSKSLSTVFEVKGEIDTLTDISTDSNLSVRGTRKQKMKEFHLFSKKTTPIVQTSSQIGTFPSLRETVVSTLTGSKDDDKVQKTSFRSKINTLTQSKGTQPLQRIQYSIRSRDSSDDVKSYSDSEQSCIELMKAIEDPNPNIWFDLLEEKMEKLRKKGDLNEKHDVHFPFRGLRRHFLAIPNGFEGLRDELNRNWEFRVKPELLLTSLIRNHLLKMPLNANNPELVTEMFRNTVVKYPLLYKMILDRREILPLEIQRFLSRILELTDTSDKVLSSIASSTTKLAALTVAAKEMDASGYLTGGPMPIPANDTSTTSSIASSIISDPNQDPVLIAMMKSGKKDSGQGQSHTYTKEKDIDKGFFIGLGNPCQNILEEVALQLPEFALHIRPLFEYRWANIETDLVRRISKLDFMKDYIYSLSVDSSQGLSNRVPNCKRQTCTTLTSANCSSTEQDGVEGINDKVYFNAECILMLFERLIVQLSMSDSILPGQNVWSDLLICLHMSNYYSEVAHALVLELDHWIPPLIIGLESPYQSVREDTCCVLAYLVSSYQLVTRLHAKSKNVLVSNIIIGLFLASKHYPQTYPFYHGVIGYMLHSIPCLSILDCILTWLTYDQNDKCCPISRDWGLFVYYILRHWPHNQILIDPMFQKKLVKQLESSLLMKHSKKASRLALGYLIRTFKVRSAVLTCWPDIDENVLVE